MLIREVPRDIADTVTVRVDFSVRQRGGKKLIIVPDGEPTWAPPRAHIDNALVKALARAFRWRKFLETGTYSTVTELAAAEKINPSYLSRILRLTLLAPEIVESILDGQHPTEMTLAVLMQPFAVGWLDQVENLSSSSLVRSHVAHDHKRRFDYKLPVACRTP